jgi:hypothetical protein
MGASVGSGASYDREELEREGLVIVTKF